MTGRVVFATSNKGKIAEIQAILADWGVPVLTMAQAGFSGDITEDGDTFADNALIKARAVWAQTKGLVMADDSGLCVDALGGEPGVLSARYLGEDTPYSRKNQAIIDRLSGAAGQERSARFTSAIAAVAPDGREFVTQADVEGLIAYEPAGDGGFGYDPIFIVPQYGKTTAQMTMEEKNGLSHRGKALRMMKELLERTGIV
ncbi:MAG: RdgB/HAM1 family non-canonical purine NTP pyrophosphatase [Lachnospiraceae bacterium]|nr:RdgB/HAM1 family non-canonical purine NTP pyrophosphatase [Lachnospiraceae bacterium]